MRFDPIAVIAAIPAGFITDGCSNSPDTLFGVDLSYACRNHDAAYCTRLWPAGALDQDWRRAADKQLRLEIRIGLPWWARCAAQVYYWCVHEFGGKSAFDSCGHMAGDKCRHGQEQPAWMQEA